MPQQNTVDYYEILEISEESSADEVRKAYRKLALKFHPDKNSSPGAAEKFKEISHAYEILSDPERREVYDRERKYGNNSFEEDQFDHFAGFHFHSPEEIFAQFFGQTFGQQPFAGFGIPGFGGGFGNSHMRGSRDMFGGGGSMFNDPFFSNDPFHAVHHDPFFSGFGGGGGMHGGTGMSHPMMHQQQHQQMLRGGMMDPLFSSSSFSSSSSSFGGGGGVSKSVSQSTQIVNGQAQTVTVTKVQDQNGTTITEDYGNGRRRVVVNGVEQHSTLGQGESNDNRRYISEGSSSAPYDRRRRF